MMVRCKRMLALVLAFSVGSASMLQDAQAALIATDEVAAVSSVPGAGDGRTRLLGALDRDDVAAALAARGVSLEQARERIAALTDREAAALADQLDRAPAGGDSILGVLLFVFVLLLVTDILGLTKIFPFTRSIR